MDKLTAATVKFFAKRRELTTEWISLQAGGTLASGSAATTLTNLTSPQSKHSLNDVACAWIGTKNKTGQTIKNKGGKTQVV